MIEGHWTYHPRTENHVEYWIRCDHTMICIYPWTQNGKNIWVNWPFGETKANRICPETFETTQLKAAWRAALKEPLFSHCTCSPKQVLLSELLLVKLEEKGLIKL